MPNSSRGYSETLRVPASWWLLGALLVVAVWWAFFVATPLAVSVVAGLVTLVLVIAALLRYGRMRVATGPSGFRAGRACLPWEYVGTAEALDQEATRRTLGVEADARAYLVVRSYCGGAVKVWVNDKEDPAPYWLVSSRHPARLAGHLNAQTMET
ncbi:MAG: DUF3093 domain-containing protein [Nocardioidaceae bacterium]